MNWKILTVTGRAYEKKYSVLPLSAKMLEASGLTEKQIEELLDTNTVLSTSQAECIQKACARIMRAKQNHEKVFVGGDYDVDGVCSTAIMKATLDALDIENGFYIPDRIKEGYGLSPKTVALAAKKGYTLIITVDNGVKAKEALQKAHELHMETIVTDHHVIEEQVECDILVHPTLLEAPFHYLSGAGIALEISRNLIGNRDDLNTMAGVASVTDVMPLWQETRKLVINALDALKQGKPHSLAALLPKGYSVDPSSIGFYIGPKLNSVGRMSDLAKVNTLPKYLLSKDDAEISRYAAQLENVNDQRKTRASDRNKNCPEACRSKRFPADLSGRSA
jgi:single-stranded-DNA-specific exonuclease